MAQRESELPSKYLTQMVRSTIKMDRGMMGFQMKRTNGTKSHPTEYRSQAKWARNSVSIHLLPNSLSLMIPMILFSKNSTNNKNLKL